MINTYNFKTKTILNERGNVSVGNTWAIALDIGYSSVKGISNNMVYSFPSYARKITSQIIAMSEASYGDILYKDNESGELWCVGSSAQDMITSDETRDSVAELYGRNRYFSEIFKVIARVGLGIGMLPNKIDAPAGRNLMIQTGLPPAYMKSDSGLLKEALSGRHNFSIKIGNRPWVSLSFDLPEENISIMAQPMGTLFSISTDNSGRPIADAAKYFRSSMLILDPGFGTLDVFNIRNKMIESSETFDTLGMKRVFQETANSIMDKYKQEISVPAMQKFLQSGEIKCRDRKTRSTSLVPFGDLLEAASEKVCLEALNRIDTIYNGLYDHDYLVITGGTGAAWNQMIREYYKGMETLNIINGNQNDTLSAVFSNARGYYMFLIGKLKKAASGN